MKKEYYPEFKYTEPKSARQGQFIVKSTREPYKGLFVFTFDKRYFSGTSPIETGIELEEIRTSLSVKSILMPLVAGSLGGFFTRKPTQSEKREGILLRYFVQDRNNGKILETDKQTYLQTQKDIANRNFTEVSWIVKGPAEDKVFGKYPFEGAESKNRKTVQALEPQMRGISTFITDYRYLVEEIITQEPLVSEIFIEKDKSTQLTNDRKANFDLRK